MEEPRWLALQAASLQVAERYIDAFGKVAKESTTLLLPTGASNPASMVAQALSNGIWLKTLEKRKYEELNVMTYKLKRLSCQDTTMRGLKQSDIYLFYLWGKYKRSSGLERAKVAKEIRESLAYMLYLDTAIDMIGLLVFGPQQGHTIIHSVRAPGLPLVDDGECLRSTSLNRSFANVCNKLVPKLSIEKSFMVTCVRKITTPHGMRN
ncbi:asparaginyl endopeptidase 1 [Tanacetum coccineum]